MTKEPVEPDPEKTVYCVVVVDVESKRKRLKIIPLPRPDPVERTQRTDTQRSSALAKRPGKKHINYLSFRSLLKGRRRRCRFGQQKQVNQPNRTRERLPTTGGIMMGWRDNNKAGRRSRSSNLRPTLSNRIRASQKKRERSTNWDLHVATIRPGKKEKVTKGKKNEITGNVSNSRDLSI